MSWRRSRWTCGRPSMGIASCRPTCSGCSAGLGPMLQKIGIHEAVHGAQFAGSQREGRAEHRAIIDAGVELTVLAARIDSRGQLRQEFRSEIPAGEAGIELFRIDTAQARPQTAGDHVACELRGRNLPEWKYQRQSRARQLLLAIGADIAQEEIAECDGIDA